MKKIVIILCLLAFVTATWAQSRFTPQQKEQDFEYLYKTLKENYPFFGILTRQTGRDWLAGHDRYLQMVRQTTDDKSYAKALQAIMRELGNGHAYVIGPHMFDQMSKLYHQAAVSPGKENKRYHRWAAMYDQAAPYYDYLKEIYGIQPAPLADQNQTDTGYDPSNTLSLMMLGGGRIGVLEIKSFMNPSGDSVLLTTLLDSAKRCEHLIIDLRRNSGGNDAYWDHHIMPHLIAKIQKWSGPSVLRRGPIAGTWYEEKFHSFKNVATLPGLPVEVTPEEFAVVIDKKVIRPKGKSGFGGKVWLFVGPGVFSASESFTAFTKATGWATVAGTRTGGDGIGSDPIPVMLPNSGFIVNFPAWGGLNPDGSFNFEARTTPDVEIDGTSRSNALAHLIHYIDPTVEAPGVAGPHVVRVEPFGNGAQDVDPSLTEIKVRFSEPMHGFSFGYGPLGEKAFPAFVKEKSGYSEDGMELTLSVKLKPDTEYQMQVLEDRSVRNKDGVSVEGYLLKVRTRR